MDVAEQFFGINGRHAVCAGLLCMAVIACSVPGCRETTTSVVSGATSDARPPLEVMHWFSTGSETAAIATIRQRFEQDGGTWLDSPMPGVAAANATSVNRMLGGRGPDVFQVSVGYRLQELARNGLVHPLPTDTAEWDAVLPEAIARAAKYQGRYVAAPIDIVGENWMFYNKAILRQANLPVPASWPEFLAVAAKLKASGKAPLALGGQAWQERILFNSVLLGTGGRDFYRRVYEHLDESALGSTEMLETFRIFGALRQYVDAASPGRPWYTATNMLIRGDAAFQFIGDWAKGEILSAGLRPGDQVGCRLAPAPERAYVMAADAFALGTSESAANRSQQSALIRIVLDPDIQVRFNLLRGSIPARLDAPATQFDVCAQLAMEVIRDPEAQLLSTGLFGLSGGMSGAIDDAISHFWNTPTMSAESGRALFVSTVAAFR